MKLFRKEWDLQSQQDQVILILLAHAQLLRQKWQALQSKSLVYFATSVAQRACWSLTHLLMQLSQPIILWPHGKTIGFVATDLHTQQSNSLGSRPSPFVRDYRTVLIVRGCVR